MDIERVSVANEWDIKCEHEKINSISPSFHVLFCLLYKHTNNDVFDDFPKISEHFPKISEDFPKLFRRLGERLQTFSEHFPKIAEDYRRLPKISEEVPPLSDYVAIAMASSRLVQQFDIFTRKIIVFLHAKIYGFSQWQKSW